MNPFFSIIIPVYNVEQYLRECLDSVFAQSFTDFEVICVNDGSTDDSKVILEEYKAKYPSIIIIHQANKGLSAARNAGIKVAKGEYILFLDSDDWIEPDALKILVKKQRGEDLICFNGRRYFEDGTTEVPDEGIIEDNLTGWEYYNKYALVNRKFHFECAVSRIYKRLFLLQSNLFFEEGIYHEDNLFTPIVCYYAKNVKVIPYCLYVYRIREGSITQRITSKHIFDTIHGANMLSDFFIPINKIDKCTIYREIAGKYFGAYMFPRSKLQRGDIKKINDMIIWENFKKVSIYPRHKRIFWLLKVSPVLFNIYLYIEKTIKKMR